MPPPLPPTSTHPPLPSKKYLSRFCTDLLPPAACLCSHGRGYRSPNPLPALSRTQWCQTYRQFSLESEANAEYAQVTDKEMAKFTTAWSKCMAMCCCCATAATAARRTSARRLRNHSPRLSLGVTRHDLPSR